MFKPKSRNKNVDWVKITGAENPADTATRYAYKSTLEHMLAEWNMKALGGNPLQELLPDENKPKKTLTEGGPRTALKSVQVQGRARP